MQPKTLTTLGKLRDGDRFYFASDKKRIVWEVRQQLTQHSTINQATSIPGSFVFMTDRIKEHDNKVVFLRHTRESLNETDALKGIV